MKKALITIIFSVVFILVGCNKDRKIIPRDEMVPILVRIHLMDGTAQIAQYNPEINIPDTMDVYKLVLEDYGYTRAQFDSSLQYYSRDLKKFDRIYQQVLARLNKMETAAQEEEGRNRSGSKTGKPSKKSGKNVPKSNN
jgi:uncharacterized lipoprotein NlpE involved in copper resistance